MNEKVGYLNLFFREDKDLGPSSIPELIADHYPSLIFIYNTGNRKIEFANQKLIEYSGRDFSNLPSSPQDLDALFHPADLAGFEKLLLLSIASPANKACILPPGYTESAGTIVCTDYRGIS